VQSVLSLPAGVDRTRTRRSMRLSVLLATRRPRLSRFVFDISEDILYRRSFRVGDIRDKDS
jgi:hypothetical protein